MQYLRNLLEHIRNKPEDKAYEQPPFDPMAAQFKKEARGKRALWSLLSLVAGSLSVGAGYWLWARSICPRLTWFALGLSAVVVVVLHILIIWIQPITDVDPRWIPARLVVLFLVPFFVTAFAATVLAPMPAIRQLLCYCDDAQDANELRLSGFYAGAIDTARKCITDSQNDETCQCECADELAHALYEYVGTTMPDQTLGNPNECPSCSQSDAMLAEAAALAQTCNIEPGFGVAVRDRIDLLSAYCEYCTPSPTPTITPSPTYTHTQIPYTLETFRIATQNGEGVAFVDFRVYLDDQYVPGIPGNEFRILINSQDITVSAIFDELDADNPICVIAVVDDSGSVEPGLTDLRAALEVLNDFRKPRDQLGMVIFGESARVTQIPQEAALDVNAVTAAGQRTAMWAGVEAGLTLTEQCSSPLRYLIVISDGVNNVPPLDNTDQARQFAALASRQQINICTVGIRSTDPLDVESLQLLQVNCDYFEAARFDELANRFRDIFGFVRDFYRFTIPLNMLSAGDSATVRYEAGSVEDTYVYQP